jgi:hypothetical protein
MAIAVVGLLSNLSTSLSNAARLTDYDRAAVLAKRTMDNLMIEPDLPMGTDLEGTWNPEVVGFEGGWRARVTPFERAPSAAPGRLALDRIEVEVWWAAAGRRRTLSLEGYRAASLTQDAMSHGPMVQ